MSPDAIEQEFKRTVDEAVRLAAEGLGRYRVFTPFTLDDGDHLAIVLRHEHNEWILSDEGHTLMRLGGELREAGTAGSTRVDHIHRTLAAFSVVDNDGELRLSISDERFGAGLHRFVGALLACSSGCL